MSESPKEWTPEAVAELVAEMKRLRTECEQCDRVADSDAATPSVMFETGYHRDQFRAAWIRLCVACQQTPLYPWAWRLDLERVRDWLNARSEARFVLVLDDLKALVDD